MSISMLTAERASEAMSDSGVSTFTVDHAAAAVTAIAPLPYDSKAALIAEGDGSITVLIGETAMVYAALAFPATAWNGWIEQACFTQNERGWNHAGLWLEQHVAQFAAENDCEEDI